MTIIQTTIRLLTFRITREEILQFNVRHFVFGLCGTWLVGMGRYWDDPRASVLQHLGIGSVIYIFILAGFIWLILKPYYIENWNYFTVLTFISLTSFPAILYAIPVEYFFSNENANIMNVLFLAIVACWRLGLLYYFLKRFTGLSRSQIFVVTLMPICLIISTLAILNLDRVVFNLMAGIRQPSSHDYSYFVLLILSFFSYFLLPFLLTLYGVGIYERYKIRKKH
ncbi:MAG TPA: hypothetical protein VKR53_00855 [Puia sp.]|nr:hypothetical protein [Puia sp.]